MQHKGFSDDKLLIGSVFQLFARLALHITSIYDLAVQPDALSLYVIKQLKMENNLLEDVLTVLVDVKVELQKLKSRVYQELVKKIDGCISKVAPLIDVYTGNSFKFERPIQSMRDKTLSHKEISTFDKKFEIKEINYEQQQEELLKVRKSFLKEDEDELDSSTVPKRDIIIDYFMFKYDFKLKQYIILGRQGGEKSDRRVFLDLFTEEKKKGDLKKLQKTESMTNILKAIYTPDKIGEPFILPNCQQQQIKYLIVFGLHECGCYEKDFFRTETLYCFVTREFILGELTNLMDSIAKICFEQRVSEISPNDSHNFVEIMENLNAKKTFHAIQEGVEDFLRNFDGYDSSPNLTVSKMERWKSNTMDHYLQRSSLRWTLLKKGKVKEQKCFQTLALLFYFAISEYKIIIISQNHNKHIISQLIVGLLSALQPLTFVYPIVTATITPHHMEFTNSPVPLMLGLWGCQEYHSIAKSSLKKLLKHQKDLSRQEMQRQTLMVFFDLEDHTIGFLQSSFKEVFTLIEKMQNYIQAKYQGPISLKLSYLLSELMQENPTHSQQWISELHKKLRETQMYEFITNKQR